MAGYNGYSMSNNAVDAYENGEMPFSKWTKVALLEKYKELCEEESIKCYDLSKVNAKVLKDALLRCSSWHHTSSMFNQTDFYSISSMACSNLTDEVVAKLVDEKPIKEEKNSSIEKWEVEYLVWGGSKKHPKATEYREVVEYDTSKNSVITSNGKKMTNANGFIFLKKVGK